MKNRYEIAVVKGDAVGPEVCESAVEVVKAALGSSSKFNYTEYPAGAEHFLKTGVSFPEETFEGCKASDAVLHGAAGLPGVVHPDGTEAGLDFGLLLRFRLDLYANVRVIKLFPGVPSPLVGFDNGGIDYVVLRENTEGLYAARGGGNLLRGEVATDTIVLTRKGTERICRFAFELSRKRNGAPRDGKRRVTCCDKANVLRTYAFFRSVFDDVATDYPDIERDYAYVDAMTCHMVRRPDFYDVIVSENMFGDIVSDLAATTAGGMGMSPTAEVGDDHGFFQAAHGSAPDIAGQGIANPIGTILSASMMLTWLGERHDDPELLAQATRIDATVERLLAEKKIQTVDIGGKAKTTEVTDAICNALA